jgi:hypothetical protein
MKTNLAPNVLEEPELIDEDDFMSQLDLSEMPTCTIGDRVRYVRDSLN